MKKLFRKVRKAVKKATSSKAGRFALPLVGGAVPYLVAKGAVAATGRGSVAQRARAFGHGAAGGALDYFRNPVIRAAGEVLPGVKPLAQASERAALVAQRNLDARRRGPISVRDVARAGADLAQAGASAAGYSVPIPRGAAKVVEKGQRAAAAIEQGSRARAHLRRVRAATKRLSTAPAALPARAAVRPGAGAVLRLPGVVRRLPRFR